MLWLLKNTIASSKAHRTKKKKSGKNKLNKRSEEDKTRKKKHPLSETSPPVRAVYVEDALSNSKQTTENSWSSQAPADQPSPCVHTDQGTPPSNDPASRAVTARGHGTDAWGISPAWPAEGHQHVGPLEGRPPSRAATARSQVTAHWGPRDEPRHDAKNASESWPPAKAPQPTFTQASVPAPTPTWDRAQAERQRMNGPDGWSAVSHRPTTGIRSQNFAEKVPTWPSVHSSVRSTDSSTLASTSEKLAWLADHTAVPALAEDGGRTSFRDSIRQQPVVAGPADPVHDWSGNIDNRQKGGFSVNNRGNSRENRSDFAPGPRHTGPASPAPVCPSRGRSHPSSVYPYELDIPSAPFKFGISVETILSDPASNNLLQLWELTKSDAENVVRPLTNTMEVATFFRHASKTAFPSRLGKISSTRMLVQGLDDKIAPDDLRRFRAWELNYECSISLDGDHPVGGHGEFGAGFVSPVVDVDERGTWRYDIENFFDVLTRKYRLAPSSTCSTHYSVLPFGGWTLVTLKSLARAIVYFEEAFRDILPLNRTSNAYCLPNYGFNTRFRFNPDLESAVCEGATPSPSSSTTSEQPSGGVVGARQHAKSDLGTTVPSAFLGWETASEISAFDDTTSVYSESDSDSCTDQSNDAPVLLSVETAMRLIDQCEDTRQLKMLMNAPAPALDQGFSAGGLDISEYYMWDFTHLTEALNNPVIFRAPPAVSNAADCKSWAEFAVTFVSAATNASPASLSGFRRDRDALYEFLKSKKMEDCAFKGSWKRLFDGPEEDGLNLISPVSQSELVWDTMIGAAEVQRRHRKPYEVLDMRDRGRRSGREGRGGIGSF